MKKNTLKAFTLVEMLIVIVIIGILIAALMPRMQAAQGRARDVSRKTALSQLQSAIATSQSDKWNRPGADSAVDGVAISSISTELQGAWMALIPTDPLKTNKVSWIWTKTTENVALSWWEYGYIITTRNWKEKGWFVLMAVTEVEWWSNWIYCESNEKWLITWGTDIADITLCSTFVKSGNACNITGGTCTYQNDSELRYIVLY